MIKSVLIFNNHGKPRLIKFYQQIVNYYYSFIFYFIYKEAKVLIFFFIRSKKKNNDNNLDYIGYSNTTSTCTRNLFTCI